MKVKKPKFDVFVAYDIRDRNKFTDLLLDRVDSLGIDIWDWDSAEGDEGEDLVGIVKKGMAMCRFGIVLMSTRVLRNEMKRKELVRLLGKRTANGVQRLLPVFLGKASPFSFADGLCAFHLMMHPRDSADRIALQLAALYLTSLRHI